MPEDKKTSRKTQAFFRVGKFGIRQTPLNIIVGEIRLVQSGPLLGTEKMIKYTESYHRNYEIALIELMNRLINDKMSKGNVDVLKGLIDSIKETKEDILRALRDYTILVE